MMIISCNQCNKKFEIESNLIPKEGRLLQCSSCNHKWFYKKNLIQQTTFKKEIKKPIQEKKIIKKRELNANKFIDQKKHKNNSVKTISFLNLIIVFIISLIALIILIDTFKNPISLVIPNIKFILNSLYETLTDVTLFIKDLI
tara:strand:- start:1058 stop:1486 length:429 start_codon:yes stop_codon:yes gene_type:complete